MSTYKFGSRALPHENHALVVSRLKWLGISSEDLSVRDLSPIRDTVHVKSPAEIRLHGMLPLTLRDRKRAVSMLRWPQLAEDVALNVRRQLQVMLVLGIKAEIQVLDGGAAGLQAWLVEKMKHPVHV